MDSPAKGDFNVITVLIKINKSITSKPANTREGPTSRLALSVDLLQTPCPGNERERPRDARP